MINSAEEFVALRTSGNADEYGRAAREEAPLAVWRELVESYPEMRRWVAHNKTVPVEILAVLVGDPDPEVRWAVALKRKLTLEMFEKLSNDEEESVRLRVVHNRKTPEQLLRRLVDDKSRIVREAARERWRPSEGLGWSGRSDAEGV